MELFRDIVFLPEGASSYAREIDALHALVITITMLGAAAVFAAALGLSWRYHRSRRPPTTPPMRTGPRLEFATIVGLLALFVALWVVGYRQYVDLRTPPADALEVWVVARQWMWQFASADGMRSEGVLVVPRDRDVRLTMTTRDVIHSFFVPAFRAKQDLVPGLTTTAWFRAEREGVFPVLCAEYCGTRHSLMRASIVVLAPTEYERHRAARFDLVASQDHSVAREPESTMASAGRDLATRYGCFGCHTVDGQPHIAPTWRNLWGRRVLLSDGSTRIADAAYLTESMMRPDRAVVAGFEPVMPSYRGVLEAADVAAIVALIRSLSESEVGPAVDLPRVRVVEEPR